MSIRTIATNISFDPYHSSTNSKDEPDNEVDHRIGLVLGVKILSKFDSKIEISQKVWAVTVAVDKGGYIIPTTFHARIIVEGIREDIGPFFQISHLQGPKAWRNPHEISNCWFGWSKFGKVQPGRMIPLSEKQLDIHAYRSKTSTWIRTREKVELMLEDINEESKSKHPVAFSFFGRRSFLTKEMQFFETKHPELLQMQKENPTIFAQLFHLHEELALFSQDRCSWENSLPGAQFTKNLCNKIDAFCTAYLDNLGLLAKVPAAVAIASIVTPIIFLPSINWYVRESFLKEQSKKHEKILDLMKRHLNKIVQIPNSCFSWTQEKLNIIDVGMPEGVLDRFISISSLYANQPISTSELDNSH